MGVAKAKSLMESIPCKITDTMGIIADVNLLNEEDEANREDNADICDFPFLPNAEELTVVGI